MGNYMTKNLKRANLEKIVEFILYGVDLGNEFDATINLEERCCIAEKKQADLLRKLLVEETPEFAEITSLVADIQKYYFALGIKAGSHILIDLI